MKRAILILAVAALGGCNLCDDPSTATFRWRFVDSRTGAPFGTLAADNPATAADETGCREAGIDTVCIEAGASGYQCFPCANANGLPAARIAPFARSFSWIVEGWLGNPFDAGAVFVFGAEGVNEVRSCSDTPIQVDLVASAPDMVLYYDVNGQEPTSCTEVGTGIILELVDGANRVVFETAARNARGEIIRQDPIPCDPGSFGFSIPNVPAGVYGLSFIQAVVPDPAAPLGVASTFEACGVVVEHFHDTVGNVFVNLETAPVLACGP
jgi:hypothetical protein